MRWIVPTCILIAGCSHGATSGGTAISSSSAGLNVQASGSTAAALIGLGIAGAVIYRSEASGYGTRYNANPFMAITGTERAPQPGPFRRVNEQNCPRPIQDISA